MYIPNRLEWHLGDECVCKPRRFLCGLVVRQASLLNTFNRFAVALAKSQDHRASCGVFAFADRTPHDRNEFAWTAWKKTPTLRHTPQLADQR
jgi:hypothetical protein